MFQSKDIEECGNMFGGVINDINVPSSVWKITVGEMLFPNTWRGAHEIIILWKLLQLLYVFN